MDPYSDHERRYRTALEVFSAPKHLLKMDDGEPAKRAAINRRARVTGGRANRLRKRRPLVIDLATKSRLQRWLALTGVAIGHLVPMDR